MNLLQHWWQTQASQHVVMHLWPDSFCEEKGLKQKYWGAGTNIRSTSGESSRQKNSNR